MLSGRALATMPHWLAIPAFSLCFAAPVALVLMLFWPVWTGRDVYLRSAPELILIAVTTAALSGVFALAAAIRPKR